jgi:hypothetical protein
VDYNRLERSIRETVIDPARAAGAQDVKILVTEMGNQDSDEGVNAAVVYEALITLYRIPEVEVIHWFKYTYPAGSETHYSLVYADGTRRQSFESFKTAVQTLAETGNETADAAPRIKVGRPPENDEKDFSSLHGAFAVFCGPDGLRGEGTRRIVLSFQKQFVFRFRVRSGCFLEGAGCFFRNGRVGSGRIRGFQKQHRRLLRQRCPKRPAGRFFGQLFRFLRRAETA